MSLILFGLLTTTLSQYAPETNTEEIPLQSPPNSYTRQQEEPPETITSPQKISSPTPEKDLRDIQSSPFNNINTIGQRFYEFRALDGSNNNINNPEYGISEGPIIRYRNSFGYADGISSISGPNRPSARHVSNVIGSDYIASLNLSDIGLSNMAWQWGQWIDHDITLTRMTTEDDRIINGENICIKIPLNDAIFTSECIDFHRSKTFSECQTTECNNLPRRQVNGDTSYLDGSGVYGSDKFRNNFLKESNSYYLKTSDYNGEKLLPLNKYHIENDGGESREDLFIGGDIRANEQIGLLTMHTLFVREHNRLGDIIKINNPSLTNDEIYEYARMIVIAEIQHITFDEFLPSFFGEQFIKYFGDYTGYDNTCDASINSIFSTAAFRVGHTMISANIPRRQSFCQSSCDDKPNINLIDAFFNPKILKTNKIGEFLAGLSCTSAHNIDTYLVREIRDFLFFGHNGDERPMDLLSFNIMRGRDHGITDYNSVRELFGLRRLTTWDDPVLDRYMANGLREAYSNNLNDIDPIAGMFAESHLPGDCAFGETIATVWAEQFNRLRNCDRFWYERYLSPRLVNYVKSIRFSQIIQWNTDIKGLPHNVFFAPEKRSRRSYNRYGTFSGFKSFGSED